MMLVVFRARRTPEGEGDEYSKHRGRTTEVATCMPGYISHKGSIGEDGERLSLFEWESAETLRAPGDASRACAGEGDRMPEIPHRVSSSGVQGRAGLEVREEACRRECIMRKLSA
jgi:heme-degrading monooxygenase HmoA